jgi:hypothetical protein
MQVVYMRIVQCLLLASLFLVGCTKPNAEMSKCENKMLVRIAEIEVNEEYLEEYLAAAHHVGAKSVVSKDGVL